MKKTILLMLMWSLHAAWAQAPATPAQEEAPLPTPARGADNIDIYLHMDRLKPLDQWSFTLGADELQLAVPQEKFSSLRGFMENVSLQVSVHLLKDGRKVRSAPVTPPEKIPMQSSQLTGRPGYFLVNISNVAVNFSGKQIYDAIKAMNTSYGDGVSTVLVPEVLGPQEISIPANPGARPVPAQIDFYPPAPAGSNAPAQIGVSSFNTSKLKRVSSARTIEERDLAFFVQQEADAAAKEAMRKDMEGRLASETAARKATEDKLSSLEARLDQEAKDRQKVEVRLLALEGSLTNFTQLEFKKHMDEVAGRFQQQAQAMSNVSVVVSGLVGNVGVTEKKLNALGASVDRLNDRSGWGNVFKRSEATQFGK